jgi:glycosyltransferase involved in cell wall biosynthesis
MAASSPGCSSVLLITPRWVRDGGVGAHIECSAAALARSGMRVSVLAARIESDHRVPGVEIFHSPKLYRREEPIRERLGAALDEAPDVVHLNQLDEPAVVSYVRERAPAVISAHGFLACTSGVHYFQPGHECLRAHGPGCIPNLVRCGHTRNVKVFPKTYREASSALAALREADLAISYSSAVDRHLAINDVPRRRIVPYFPTVTPRQGSGHSERRRVVFAGRVVASKGVFALVRAAAQVEGEFVVCGDGHQLAAMRRLATRLGVAERMSFKGWLAPEELAQEFADASLVVVPSLWPEPFGLVGIEAFAAGRPAVASATGGIGDWLDDGVSGLLVRAGDAKALARTLDELLADPDRQRAMGAAGRETVESRFSSTRHVEVLREAYGAAREAWSAR